MILLEEHKPTGHPRCCCSVPYCYLPYFQRKIFIPSPCLSKTRPGSYLGVWYIRKYGIGVQQKTLSNTKTRICKCLSSTDPIPNQQSQVRIVRSSALTEVSHSSQGIRRRIYPVFPFMWTFTSLYAFSTKSQDLCHQHSIKGKWQSARLEHQRSWKQFGINFRELTP